MSDNRQDRLEEIMAEMLIKQDAIIDELKGANKRLEHVDVRLGNVEKQLVLNNKGIGELRLSVMKLAERDKLVNEQNKRLRKIEMVLAKNKMM